MDPITIYIVVGSITGSGGLLAAYLWMFRNKPNTEFDSNKPNTEFDNYESDAVELDMDDIIIN